MTRIIFRHSAATVAALAVLILAGGATWAQSNDPPPKPKNGSAQAFQQILQQQTPGVNAPKTQDVLIDRWQRNNTGK